MGITSPKSSLSPRRESRGKVPEVTCEKVGFEPRVKKGVKEGRNDDDAHELPRVKCCECEGG